MQTDAQLVMLEHSKAKVELYSTYLSRFLNILSRSRFIDTIHIYDLMCGEGVYEDNSEGSPIVALKKIKEHYFINNKTCPDMILWFNDLGLSKIETEKLKIQRVKEKCDKIFRPYNVVIDYTQENIVELLPTLQLKINDLKNNDRLLLFIDPYGYKEIGPFHLKNLLNKRQVELLLFIPISNMQRFAKKALLDENYAGGEAIRKFLRPLLKFGFKVEHTADKAIFIDSLRNSLKLFLEEEHVYVDTFALERDKANTYCLFFFTHHIVGFQKMLEVKWELDTEQGRGFKLPKTSPQISLFENLPRQNRVEKYAKELENAIKSAEEFTNSDLFSFGLYRGFLPKHSNQILRDWQNNRVDFLVLEEDNKTNVRKNSFYNSYENFEESPKTPKRRIKFKFKSNV